VEATGSGPNPGLARARNEFRQLLDLARRLAEIELEMSEDDAPTLALAFDCWTEEGEDVYSVIDGDPV